MKPKKLLDAPIETIKNLNKVIPYKLEKRDSTEVYVITIDGNTAKKEKARKMADKRALEYGNEEDKVAAITSKPIIEENSKNQWYFTRNGFKGTMALNEDTLLSGDVYKPSEDEEEDDEGWTGQIEKLSGSKTILKQMNEGTILESLLTPQKVDKTTMLTLIGTGVAAGFIIAQYMVTS